MSEPEAVEPRWRYQATALGHVPIEQVNEHLDAQAVAGWELVSGNWAGWGWEGGGNVQYTMFWRRPALSE